MKITLSGQITSHSVEKMLADQEEKKQKIIAFCKTNKIEKMQYKDSELEFEYVADNDKKQFANPKPKVETRGGVKDAKE